MQVVLLQSAKDDLRDGFLFYARQGGEHLGYHFLASLQGDLSALSVSGGIHGKHFGCHRALSRRFPYSIYYDIVDGKVRVYGILGNRRDPGWIGKRLKEVAGQRQSQFPSL